MAIVVSRERLVDPSPGTWWPTSAYGQMRLYNDRYVTYEALYRTQPNVRTCVDFLARNVAQLGLHVFQRVSETDRQRLRDHPLAQILGAPNPWTTRFRLIQGLMSDLGLYFNAYWLKVAQARMRLLRVPPALVTVHGGLIPDLYEIDLAGREPMKLPPGEIVHFRGYNPSNPLAGLSPMETLRRVLAEEHAMGRYREGFWSNAARMSGIIERPLDAPEWSPTARERFRSEFEAMYTGEDSSGRNTSGKTAILEEGMTWRQIAFNAEESEYLGGRKLTREECARAYHIPLPMVGILDHATFSNIREQHKNLYQDCLGPWLRMIEEEIELQLLSDLPDAEGVYCEFNIAEKLAGSFEEQTASLQSAVGRPWMTADEARARMNLPSMGGDAEQLVTPLNVLVGGQASPRDSAPESGGKALPATKAARELDPTLPELRDRHIEQWQRVLTHTFNRQRRAVMSHLPAKADMPMVIEELWDARRWNAELEADYYRLNNATAQVWANYTAKELGAAIDPDRMAAWLAENARISAEEINGHTRDLIAAALTAEVIREAVAHVFDLAVQVRAPELAVRAVTTASVFGSQEAARQGGLRTKMWQVNSLNPRKEHQALDGETVGINELFSNGMRWPGDPAGGAENNANCKCSLAFGR